MAHNCASSLIDLIDELGDGWLLAVEDATVTVLPNGSSREHDEEGEAPADLRCMD